MKKSLIICLFAGIGLFAFSIKVYSGDIGTTFCWHNLEMDGGHSYPFNQSITKSTLSETEWWENMVEEVDYSSVDYIALLSRGYSPIRKDRGNGNPAKIIDLVKAMDTRGVNSFKLALFDDCPNSWTGNMNWDKTGVYTTSSPKFDCADTTNYKYIWEYNLKAAIGNIPDAKRYKIDGRMVIIFWSVKSVWMSNIQGNLTKILQYIKTKCFDTYGFYPYFIIDKDWLDVDSGLQSSNLFDAVHNWFSSAGHISWTTYLWNGHKTGVSVAGFGSPTNTPYIDPNHGQTLITGLNNTINSGASLTLCEGFTDAAESAALWRSNDMIYYDYPNQRLNILRRYSKKAYSNLLKVEVEGCDSFNDLTTGNSGGAFRFEGDLDIVKCTDTYGGWNITNTQAGEWMEWKELPLLKNTKFQLRYKSTSNASINFSVDGTDLSVINLPSTYGIWKTIDAGDYTTTNNSLHTVRVTVLSGTPDLNYFNRVDNSDLNSDDRLISGNCEISIFPNPVSNQINIKLNDTMGSQLNLILYDLNGNVRIQNTINQPTESVYKMDVSQMNPGLYLLKITSQNKSITKKINIEK